MKHIIAIAAGILAFSLTVCFAHAGTPTVVTDSGSSQYAKATGTFGQMSITKDTTSGNRVEVRFVGGEKYVADDQAWSRHAKLRAAMGAPVSSSDGNYTLDASVAIISCDSTTSPARTYITWHALTQSEYIPDGCVLANAAKAAGQ